MAAQRVVFSYRQTGIHSLPVELLTRIFVLGAGFDYPYADSPFLLKPEQAYAPAPSSNFQLVVSHVCQHWRQVALRTPSLWTTLHFREKSHVDRAKAYLARCTRSTSYLLDILFDSVAEEDYFPGVTLYKEEVRSIFQIITPHVKRWRSFHLKICDNDCKGLARQFLSTCGPAPNLETLQLYHFEDYRTTQNLYLATYRPPVIVFSNSLPRLRNVSLIGVNLPWEKSPYLMNLCRLELALHPDNIRPPFRWWKRMLRLSPELEVLCLHYSGPKTASGDQALDWPPANEKIPLPRLQGLSLTDLDPDYLCILLERLTLPNIQVLTLDLPDQDYTPFLELITKHLSDVGDSPKDTIPVSQLSVNIPIASLSSLSRLTIRALECSWHSWVLFFEVIQNLRVLEVDFARVGPGFWKIFSENRFVSDSTSEKSDLKSSSPILPHLEVLKISGVSGKDILSGLCHRYRQPGYRETCPKSKWIVGWTERRRGIDTELDALIDQGYWRTDGKEVLVVFESFDDGEIDFLDGSEEGDPELADGR